MKYYHKANKKPKSGVWIIESKQQKGYAYKALREVLNYVGAKYGKDSFFYEADIRNIASTNLLHKFEKEYEIIYITNMNNAKKRQIPERPWNCKDIFLNYKIRLMSLKTLAR